MRFRRFARWALTSVAVLVVVPLAAGIGAADASSGTPSAPVIGTATGGNGQVTVTWTVPANDGSPITSFIISGTYVSGSPFDGTAVGSDTVDAGSVGSSTDPTPGASDSFVYAGLANGVGYSFSIEAANANGAGTASAQSNTATTGTTPQAPSSLVAVAGSQAVQLNWTVLNNGGSPVTDFVVTPSIGSMAQAAVTIPVGAVGSALDPTPFSSDSYELGGLANGTAYTFTIAAKIRRGGPERLQVPRQPLRHRHRWHPSRRPTSLHPALEPTSTLRGLSHPTTDHR